MHKIRNWTLFSLAISFSVAACGGDDITLPSEGEPAHIEVVAGNDQYRPVNSQLDPLVVKVTDSRDRPVSGATVIFELEEGSEGGSITPSSTQTGPDGLAKANITLGTQVGQLTGQAKLSEEDVAAAFVATALPSNANTIRLVSGDPQTGSVGSTLEAPLVVQVTDNFGNPIADVEIQWSVTGGGSVSEEATRTGSDGQTWVQRTLGSTAGQQTTVATAQGLAGSPITFTHTATAGNAARVRVVSGDGQQAAPGTQLPQPLVVQVLDAENNPIVMRAVAWVIGAGEGSVTPESTTDAEGKASAQWTLGPAPGRNTVTAVVSGVGIAAFSATATKTATSLSIVSHQPEPSAPGQAVEVRVQVSGSGGTPSGTVSVTGDGASPCTITLASGSGACSLTFGSAGNQRITATYNGDARFNGSSQHVNHRVEAPNGEPTAAFDPPSCTEGQPCQFDDKSSDDGQIVSWNWNFGDGGSSGEEDPTYLYEAAGTFSVTLTVTDDKGATNTVTHQVQVQAAPAPNTPPVATNDQYSAAIGETFHAPGDRGNGLLANDADLDGDALSASPGTSTTSLGGSVTIAADGSFDYTAPSVAGNDSFSYTVNDGRGGSAVGTVTIIVQ